MSADEADLIDVAAFAPEVNSKRLRVWRELGEKSQRARGFLDRFAASPQFLTLDNEVMRVTIRLRLADGTEADKLAELEAGLRTVVFVYLRILEGAYETI